MYYLLYKSINYQAKKIRWGAMGAERETHLIQFRWFYIKFFCFLKSLQELTIPHSISVIYKWYITKQIHTIMIVLDSRQAIRIIKTEKKVNGSLVIKHTLLLNFIFFALYFSFPSPIGYRRRIAWWATKIINTDGSVTVPPLFTQ